LVAAFRDRRNHGRGLAGVNGDEIVGRWHHVTPFVDTAPADAFGIQYQGLTALMAKQAGRGGRGHGDNDRTGYDCGL